ncbi:MAG: hypothetical protein JWO68_984 [Actinomycetia bacterium]|nr:hypothetical protein [Actinomycetes bacterium]
MNNKTSRRAAQPIQASMVAAVALALFAGACSSDSGSDGAAPAKRDATTTTVAASPTTDAGDGGSAGQDGDGGAGEAVSVWEVPENQMVLPATLATDTRSAEGFEGPDGGLWTGIDEEGDDGRFGVVEPDGSERWTSDSTTLAGGTFDVDEKGLAYQVGAEVTLLDPDGDEGWTVELNEGTEVVATALTEIYVLVQECPSDDVCGWSAIDRESGTAGPVFEVERSEDDVTFDRPAAGYVPIGEVDDRLIFVSDESQATTAYSWITGERTWTIGRGSFIDAEGTLATDGLELDPDTGEEAGDYEPVATSDTSTMLTMDSVSLVDGDDEELWSYDIEPHGTEGVVNNMASTDDVVLVESGDELVALDRESGDLVGTVDLDEDTSDIAAADAAFVVTLDSGRQLVVSFA